MKLLVIFTSGALIVLGVAGAVAHGGATGIVKERMVAMGAMGKVMKSLSVMMRGEGAYDAETVRNGAAGLDTHSGAALTQLFPANSISGPSEAVPEIWSNWQEFQSLSDNLERYSIALGHAADNGLRPLEDSSSMMGQTMMGSAGMMGQSMMGNQAEAPDPQMLAQMPVQALFNMTAQTCSTCHTKFRVEK